MGSLDNDHCPDNVLSREYTVARNSPMKRIATYFVFGQWVRQFGTPNSYDVRLFLHSLGLANRTDSRPTRYLPHHYCEDTKKVMYSESAANRAIEKASKMNDAYVPRRAYFCNYCGMYHLTSQAS